MNNINLQNMQKHCRACLKAISSTQIVTGEEKQVSADGEEQPQAANNLLSPNVCKLFLDFTALDVSLEVEEFPKHVCELCLANLMQCDDFRKKALASTRILQESLKNHLIGYVADEVGIHKINSFIKEEPNFSDSEIDPKQFCDVGIADNTMDEDVDLKINADGDENGNCNVDIDEHDNGDDDNEHEDIGDKDNDDFQDDKNEDLRVYIDEAENYEDEHASDADKFDDSVRSNSSGSQSESPVYERLSENHDDQTCDTNIGAEDDTSVTSKTTKIPTKDVKNNKLYCFECNKQFRMDFSFKAHMLKVHHGIAKPFACEKCSKAFTTNKQLNVHIQDNCGVKKNNTVLKDNIQYRVITSRGRQAEAAGFSCEICGKELRDNRSLIVHVKRHKGIKNFHCPRCDMSKTTAHELNVHMRVHDENMEKFKCSQCPQTFSHKNAVARHVRVKHEGIRSFLCSLCPKRFATRNALICHEKGTHGEGRNFLCQICHRSFTMEKTLINHLKKHRKITCNLCPKRFMNLKTLAAHQKVHLGDNPIICTKCSHGFHNILDLQDHSKQHENDICVDDNAVTQEPIRRRRKRRNVEQSEVNLENAGIDSGSPKKVKRSRGECGTVVKTDIKATTETDNVNSSPNNKNTKEERRSKSVGKRSNNISDRGSPGSSKQKNKRNKMLTVRHSARSSSRNKRTIA